MEIEESVIRRGRRPLRPSVPRGFATPSRVLSQLASLAINEEPSSDLLCFLTLVSRVARACTLLTKSN